MRRGLVRVLFVEDEPLDVELTLMALREAGLEIEHVRVDTAEALRQALSTEWDVVISDFEMNGFNGFDALDIVKSKDSDLAFIFVSGVLGEDRAVAAMRAGARDYVLKGKLGRLGVAVEREAVEVTSRRRRRQTERALYEQRKIFDGAAIGLVTLDLSEVKESHATIAEALPLVRIRAMNAEAAAMFEGSPPTQGMSTLGELLKTPFTGLEDLLREIESPGRYVQREISVEVGDGRMRRWVVSGRVPTEDEGWDFVVVSLLDVTERWQLEQSLQRAARMEALGRLAGAVAHDFNNLLTVIGSSADHLVQSDDRAANGSEDVRLIREASDRATALTRQLLAFSRDEIYKPVVLEPNLAVARMERLLSRLLDRNIKFRCELAAERCRVLIDPIQLDQIVLNLATNARDAMPNGGTLTLSTAMVPSAGPKGVPHVCLKVSDTGHGMDKATRAKLFEPFFTSKPSGRGTGLGLAIVASAVDRAGGFIEVESAADEGTTFSIFLPCATTESVPATPQGLAQGGDEVILLVDDDDLVLRSAKRILAHAGYHVLVASNGAQALELAARHSIDVVVSDVAMPTLDGLALRRALPPGLPVLLTSGYSAGALRDAETAEILAKPFTSMELLTRVRLALQGRRA